MLNSKDYSNDLDEKNNEYEFNSSKYAEGIIQKIKNIFDNFNELTIDNLQNILNENLGYKFNYGLLSCNSF